MWQLTSYTSNHQHWTSLCSFQLLVSQSELPHFLSSSLPSFFLHCNDCNVFFVQNWYCHSCKKVPNPHILTNFVCLHYFFQTTHIPRASPVTLTEFKSSAGWFSVRHCSWSSTGWRKRWGLIEFSKCWKQQRYSSSIKQYFLNTSCQTRANKLGWIQNPKSLNIWP